MIKLLGGKGMNVGVVNHPHPAQKVDYACKNGVIRIVTADVLYVCCDIMGADPRVSFHWSSLYKKNSCRLPNQVGKILLTTG